MHVKHLAQCLIKATVTASLEKLTNSNVSEESSETGLGSMTECDSYREALLV